jgi:polysaccharide pyruvyl transferase WcaK-like protein/MoaA/NifB/PqqE/SkfB family radical SAM enzyme
MNLLPILEYFSDWFTNPARRSRQPSLPTILNLPITDNCNARCVMCDVWKTDSSNEVTPSQLQTVLSDKLFQKIKHVGISGGEPALRPDLVDHVVAVIASLPALRSLSITSHGFLTARWEKFLPKILSECRKKGIKFTFNLSLDGVGQVHDNIRRIPGGYKRVLKTFESAHSLGINVVFQSTISKNNVYNLNSLLDNAWDVLDSEIDFRVATEIERLNNHHSVREVELDENQRSFFADFLDSKRLADTTPSPARRLFYKDLAHRLRTNNPRSAPCFYQNEGVLLSAHGDLYHCSISSEAIGNVLTGSGFDLYFSSRSRKIRSELLSKKCPSCLHDQSGAWKPTLLIQETLATGNNTRKVFWLMEALSLGLRALVSILRSLLLHPLGINDQRFSTAMIIGAYGGEHVGDAAILGGVILRLQRKFEINKIIVNSFRPDRTKRWIRSIASPVELEVIDQKTALGRLAEVDCVVWAGGPLMDLPRLLVAHLDFITRAIAMEKPFWLEGIGIGPFKLWFSKSLARIILRLASKIRVRTKKGMLHPILEGYKPELSIDPAFDYLKTRKDILLLSKNEYEQINDFVEMRGFSIGINLRPFWSKYLLNIDSDEAQKHFIESFALSLLQLRKLTSAQFLFFPMNSDQYGFSDLEVAQQLKSQLPPNFPFKIWEIEPDIDAVLAFLRHLDLVIAMRFHACIFALSQDLPTIGIDYSQGQFGKVRELFIDFDLEERVCGIADFQPDWLVNTVQTMLDRIKQ